MWANEMTHYVSVLATKSEELYLNPRTHRVEGAN